MKGLALLVVMALMQAVVGEPKQKEVIIHMDLKGAPPKMPYFLDLLTTFSQLGATGVLIEWEDMFPFKGVLEPIKNGNAYSERDVSFMLSHASALGLKVIPLVQTIGHLEWVLKTKEFREYREDDTHPQVICVGDEKAQDLVLEMVNQVLSLHSKYSLEFFHIGADEVFQIGICEADKVKLKSQYGNDTQKLIFDHIRKMAKNITEESPRTKVLTWYDEFKTASPIVIKQYSLDELVTPVVWKYTQDLDKDLPLGMWSNLSYSFPSVWGGSAIKGADGANTNWNNVKPYIKNNQEWYIQAYKYSQMFPDFHGVMLTAWQRYDHFATLCELWPVSMASLAMNIKIIKNYVLTDADVKEISAIYNCPEGTTWQELMDGTDNCRFPGYQARNAIRSFNHLKEFHENSKWVHTREAGWLQPSQRVLAASNTYIVDPIRKTYKTALDKMNKMIPTIRSTLDDLYFPDVAEEFLVDQVMIFYEDLKERYNNVMKIDSKSSFAPRPWFK